MNRPTGSCPRCGTADAAGGVCSQCGSPLPPVDNGAPGVPRWFWMVGTAGILAVAGVVATVLVVTSGGGPDSPSTTEPTTRSDATANEPVTTYESGQPVVVCELAYYTGEFAPFGQGLTADVIFPIDEVINVSPPLGRPWVLMSEDIGTVGESQAARTCLEKHHAEILLSVAHGYQGYRSWLLNWIATHDSPLMPTVHGGTIPPNLGGVGWEPIFRGQGFDEAPGVSGVLFAETIGAETVVVFATQEDVFQRQADTAQRSAEAIGMNVLARIDVTAQQTSYVTEAEEIAGLNPEAVIVLAGASESAALIAEAATAGASLHWIGEAGWIQTEFMEDLGTAVLSGQQSVGFAEFTYRADTPAWDFFQPLLDGTPGHYGAEAESIYAHSAYDLLIQTALAVEYAGSYSAIAWAPAMFEVGEPPGQVCYTYADCISLIREGNDIDYEGVTGSGTYSPGGVNDVVQAYTPFLPDGTLGIPVYLDGTRALRVIDLMAIKADCDVDNECTW